MMLAARDGVAVINAGSSSIKFSLFAGPGLDPVLKGKVDGLYSGPTRFAAFDATGRQVGEHAWPGPGIDHPAGIDFLVGYATRHLDGYRVRAVGHRIVHGGSHYSGPQALDVAVLATLESLVPLAPRYLTAGRRQIRRCRLTARCGATAGSGPSCCPCISFCVRQSCHCQALPGTL